MHKLFQYPVVHEALLYCKLPNDKARCGLCERRCQISPSLKGFCKTRTNIGGKLYTLVYGDISALESRPIEIKPFFHYWPGSTVLTFSTWSCNLDCVWCQNYYLSKTEPNPAKSSYFPPEKIVAVALHRKDEGLCVSFQEPTILTDWAVQVFRVGRKKGLYCCYVSNEYMTPEALKLLRESGMDGLKIDIKGDAGTYEQYCGGADVEKIWRNIRKAKKMGFHVEIVNLVVTGINDNEECLRWVIEKAVREAGPETPLHFTRYYPAYKFNNPPTRVETLERAYKMAKEAGILYPYVGNVHSHRYENTYCPKCGRDLILRLGNRVVRYKVTATKKCPGCGASIPVVGEHIKKTRFLC